MAVSTEDPLWEFAKYVFDFAVFDCALMFEQRGGFLTQSKLPYYHRDEWNKFLPEPLRMMYAELPQVFVEYQHFLEERKQFGDAHALLYLKKYQDSNNAI